MVIQDKAKKSKEEQRRGREQAKTSAISFSPYLEMEIVSSRNIPASDPTHLDPSYILLHVLPVQLGRFRICRTVVC
jgi:hypothetical protein